MVTREGGHVRTLLHPVVALFVVAVAACQGSTAPTGNTAASQPAASSRPASTAAATTAAPPSAVVPSAPPAGPTAGRTLAPAFTPEPSPGLTAGTGPSGSATPFHAAAELEHVLPAQAGGLPLAVESVTGAGFSDANGAHSVGLRCRWYDGRGLRCRDQKTLVAALAALGRALGDVTVAVGYNETKNKEIEVQATRITGVTGAQVRDAVLAVMRDAALKAKRTLKTTDATVGGKSVTVITYASPYPLGLRRYLYASGDLFFDIRRAYDAPAAEILQALP
jgi:hypothetical protein